MKNIDNLIGYIIKTDNELQEKNYRIKPNEEYQITDIKKIEKCTMIELTGIEGNTFDVDVEYLINNFKFICKMD